MAAAGSATASLWASFAVQGLLMSHPVRSGTLTLLALLALGAALAAKDVAERHWPQWRGPRGDGVAPQGRSADDLERDGKRPLQG